MDKSSESGQVIASGIKIAVTGIRDSTQESFITSALIELGWQVNLRAISAEVLQIHIKENPTHLVVISDDFMSVGDIVENRLIFIRGRARPIDFLARANPLNANDLNELIKNEGRDESLSNTRIQPTSKELILFTSATPRIGTSTLALNIAQEASLLGRATLLIDAHPASPYVSNQIEAHRIDQQILPTKLGFSVTEVVTLESLRRVSVGVDAFDLIIVDYGVARFPPERIGGQRARDVIATWALESANRIFLLSTNGREEIKATRKLSQTMREYLPQGRETIAMNLDSVLSRRERGRFSNEMGNEFGQPPLLFSRERKAILAMEEAHTTLAINSPKSILRGEIVESLNSLLAVTQP